MKIEDKRTDKDTSFGELSIGDCFIFEDECYIRIDELCASPNVFNLVRNEIDTIKNSTLPITKVNAKVVME